MSRCLSSAHDWLFTEQPPFSAEKLEQKLSRGFYMAMRTLTRTRELGRTSVSFTPINCAKACAQRPRLRIASLARVSQAMHDSRNVDSKLSGIASPCTPGKSATTRFSLSKHKNGDR
eukprot:6203847-Pleurochrysis_carterae.AAC.1